MSQLVEGGRPIARLRLFGFPVTLDVSFVVIVAILGWYPGVPLRDYVVWLAMVPLAVLVHELGHAFVARTTGASPAITLAGLGGLTSYLPPRPLSRARSVAISIAGPAVGIIVGGALLGYGRAVGVGSDLAGVVLGTAIYTTLGWSLLNMLPILPLDGGQALRELLPGSPAKRAVRAAVVSIVTAVLAAVVAYQAGFVFGALLAAFFVVSNVMTVREAREQSRVDVNQRVVQLLWADRLDDARDLVADPSDPRVSPLVRAVVRAAEPGGAGRAGLSELESWSALHPSDPTGPGLLVLGHRVRGDWSSVRQVVAQSPSLDAGTVLAAQTIAARSGQRRAASEIGQAWLDRHPGKTDGVTTPDRQVADQAPGLIACATAAGWAQEGDPARALAAFRAAADLGYADLTRVDSDDDLAPLRPLPGYDEARQAIRDRALAVLDQHRPGP